MNTKSEITSNVEDTRFSWWDEETETAHSLVTEGDFQKMLEAGEKAGKDWRFILVDATNSAFIELSCAADRDLKQIWERLDKLERRLESIDE